MKNPLQFIAPYRLRLVFRGVFLALMLGTVYLALYVLAHEKELSYQNYQHSFRKTKEQIAATLRHPAGQLALLNPNRGTMTPLHPLLLPFSAIDFDDQHKAQQAAEMAGCLVQYKEQGALCVAIGNNPWAGGFIYVVGNFNSTELVPHPRGEKALDMAHRVRVRVAMRGQTYHWVAPFETLSPANNGARAVRGRLTGFADSAEKGLSSLPAKDFRGWIWQSAHCQPGASNPTTAAAVEPAAAGVAPAAQPCLRNASFSIRLPVVLLQEALQEAVDGKTRPSWPPPDLDKIDVHIQVLPPATSGQPKPILDSDSPNAVPPFAISDLAPMLLPGETLTVYKQGGVKVAQLTGAEASADEVWHWLSRVIRRIPVQGYDAPMESREAINTSVGSYEVLLKGDVRSVNKTLGVVATRIAWFVVAMVLALALAWTVLEVRIIHRIAILTRRAATLSKKVKGAGGLEEFDVADLRGADELGILASCLHDLLRRVREDVQREAIRAEQEKQMWHAVGHEIMSPLQSLLVLHGDEADPSNRYIHRMQQAVRILYGSASPSEAFQSSVLEVSTVDLSAFLSHVADNAPCAGIDNVVFERSGATDASGPVLVRADEYSLEDVVTHVLRNAERYRTHGTPIVLRLAASETAASITIHNEGPNIDAEMIDKIFEYGVSDQQEAAAHGNRGQGLFVAKTYMAKMGGTITAQNVANGVVLVLGLQRVTGY